MFSCYFSKRLVVSLILSIIIFHFYCCESIYKPRKNPESNHSTSLIPFAYEGIHEFKKGDIIVRPNLNIFPGTAIIGNGNGFGHAALVVSGYKHENIDSLLAGITIIESIAKDVPVEFQVREISGLVENKIAAFNNTNFNKQYLGNRFRLRLALSDNQIDSVVAFALMQKNDYSAWNASKSFNYDLQNSTSNTRKNWADNNTWYCSLLVWQAVYYVTGLDLDPNQGYMVYPNDLINSRYFDNTDSKQGRTKF
jgi:hypothetical protein